MRGSCYNQNVVPGVGCLFLVGFFALGPKVLQGSSCLTRLVFNVGLHKMGATTFGIVMHQLGYSSIKLPKQSLVSYSAANLERDGFGALGSAFNLGNLAQKSLAVSDFPVFGFACELSAAYEDARFMIFERDFGSWFQSFRQDILCKWMHTGKSSDEHGKMGEIFMRRFWGDAYSKWERQKETVCQNPNSSAWHEIEQAVFTVFQAHLASLECIQPERFLSIPLNELKDSAANVTGFLGCDPIDPENIWIHVSNSRQAPWTSSSDNEL